jgi:hypothetical protein
MNLKLKAEYEGKDIILTFWEKGQQSHYTLKRLKPHQYQRLYDNGYQHLFDIENINTDEMVNLYEVEDEQPKGLIDNTSYKKKAVTAKKSK